MDRADRVLGSLFGMALGDALGSATEFMDFESIVREYGPEGPGELYGNPALVTDDTQMALAVGGALIEAPRPLTAASVEPVLRRWFVAWATSPENNRAPGITCMDACERLEMGKPWVEATIPGSKGCGANIRVQPVGLLSAVDEPTRAALAQFQAAMTHGHPTGLAAADLTAATIAYLVADGKPADLPVYLRRYVETHRRMYHIDWLGSLWQRSPLSTPEDFIEYGWQECIAVLDRLDAALINPDPMGDPCRKTGAGWVAEEAFATGLLCFLMFPDHPIRSIRRAAGSSGDSDSIACLAGAFAGAYKGISAWPVDWLNRIEYHDRLEGLGHAL